MCTKARHNVVGTPGGKRHYHAHRLGGVILKDFGETKQFGIRAAMSVAFPRKI
jgi:hypothetical protein